MGIIVINKESIIDCKTECVVNAANKSLAMGSGVCGAIFKAAGAQLLTDACRKIGYCETGEAVITPAFNLENNKYIIHAVGPIYSYSLLEKSRNDLYNAYKHSLEVMIENGCKSITFPLISTGIYGYPVEEGWKIAIKACNDFINLHEHDNIRIYFAILNDNIYNMGNNILKEFLKQSNDNPTTRLYEAVHYLHIKGYQKLRIMSYYSMSGCYFRTELSVKEAFDKDTGFVLMDYDNFPVYKYTTGQGYCYFKENESLENSSVEELAMRLLAENPELEIKCNGEDFCYANLFDYVVKISRNYIFPYAFEDYGYCISTAGGIKLTNGDFIEYAPPGIITFDNLIEKSK